MINYQKFERDYKLSKIFDYDLFDNDTYRSHSEVIKYLLEIERYGYVMEDKYFVLEDSPIYNYIYDDKELFSYYIDNGKRHFQSTSKIMIELLNYIDDKSIEYLSEFIADFKANFINYKKKEMEHKKFTNDSR